MTKMQRGVIYHSKSERETHYIKKSKRKSPVGADFQMAQNACGASFGIPPSMGRPMTTAATESRIPPLAGRGGWNVAPSVAWSLF